jgi:PAS domain S-box-containing protein
LGQQLVESLPPEQAVALRPRLNALIGELAIGFFRQAHETIITEQEQARTALSTELERTKQELRKYREKLEELIQERTANLMAAIEQLEREITERRRISEALQESEGRYRIVSELTSDYAYAVRVELDGVIVPEWSTAAFTRITGFTLAEMKARVGWVSLIHPDDLPIALQLMHDFLSNQSCACKLRIVTKHGETRWVHVYGRPVWDDREKRVVRIYGAVQDVTEHKRADDQIQASLREKEILLEEIHHRVKNNLEVISSLLDLQSGYVHDEQAAEMFRESQNRVISMARVHERLYQSKDMSRVDFAAYTLDLVRDLCMSYGTGGAAVVPKVSVADVALDINAAITCGLIINELVSNSLKHAFPEGRTGEIYVDLHPADNDQLVLTVGDNGTGLSQDITLRSAKTFGLRLVNLLTRQLRGTLQVDRDAGTKFIITFATKQAS